MSVGTIFFIVCTTVYLALSVSKRTRPYAWLAFLVCLSTQAIDSLRHHDYAGVAMFFIVVMIIGSDMLGKRKGWVGRFMGNS